MQLFHGWDIVDGIKCVILNYVGFANQCFDKDLCAAVASERT